MRVLVWVSMVGAAVVTGCGGGADRAPEAAPGLATTVVSGQASPGAAPRPGPYAGPCLELPAPAPPVDWLPEGLPLPAGAYLVEGPVGDESFASGTLAVPVPFGEFVQFVLTEWADRGWVATQTEVEIGEADGAFVRGDEWGTFVARRVHCEENWSEVVLEISTS